MGIAEFICTTQPPNNSVSPGTAFTIDTTLINTIPTVIVLSAAAGGSVFTLNAQGLYVVDYEMSLTTAGSIALYIGPNSSTLAIDNNTISGSSTATTWIHGRAVINVPTTTPVVFALSSAIATMTVTTAGTAAGFYIVRLTILKVA